MAIPGLFFFIFVFSIKLSVNDQYKNLPMTGFEPQASGIGATAPPTEPQPLPSFCLLYGHNNLKKREPLHVLLHEKKVIIISNCYGEKVLKCTPYL